MLAQMAQVTIGNNSAHQSSIVLTQMSEVLTDACSMYLIQCSEFPRYDILCMICVHLDKTTVYKCAERTCSWDRNNCGPYHSYQSISFLATLGKNFTAKTN